MGSCLLLNQFHRLRWWLVQILEERKGIHQIHAIINLKIK